MAQVIPLLAAAALVGVLHMSAPDHWVTLCLFGQKAAWSRTRLLGFGAVTAGGHVLLSITLGFGIVLLGEVFSQALSVYLTTGTGAVMVVAGLAYGFKTLSASTSEDYDLEAGREVARAKAAGRGLGYFAILGGALSPDLSILPIFLLASRAALGVAVNTALIFALASVLSLLALVTVGSVGVARAFSRAPAKYNDSLVGFVIAAVGAYILFFG